MIGSTLNHYRILSLLGRGGMGEVYVAEDVTLRRKIALKILPEAVAGDLEARRRFEREARALAALNHPNIVTIHSIEESGGHRFLTMELVDGLPLSSLVGEQGLPLDRFYDLAIPITEALAAAHREGVLHRDLKPQNIVVSNDGRPKILDFGLARIRRPAEPAMQNSAELSTQTVTSGDALLGTLAYMSPEQIQGEPVDARSDLFSLGVSFYEMLTGRRPFAGESSPAIMASILRDEPLAVSEVVPRVPAELSRVVTRCLKKDPGERYPNARTLREELRESRNAVGGHQHRSSSLRVRHRSRGRQLLVVGASLGVLGAATWLQWRQRTERFDPAARSIAVVDFQDLSGAPASNVASAVTSLVNVGVLESSPYRVLSLEYLKDLRRRRFGDPQGPIRPEEALALAREAGAGILLLGDVGDLGATRYVAWRLVDTSSGRNLGGRRAVGQDPMTLVDRVVAEVIPLLASLAQAAPAREPRPVTDLTTVSAQAYDDYMAGRRAAEAGRPDSAAAHFRNAIAIDSTFALAYFALSECTPYTWEQERKRAYADRAWQHRDRLGVKDALRLEAYREGLYFRYSESTRIYEEILDRWPDDREALATVAEGNHRTGFASKALAVCDSGRRYYPDDPTLTWIQQSSLAAMGRVPEALALARSQAELHQDDPTWSFEVAERLLDLGTPDSAEAVFRSILARDSSDLDARLGIVTCLEARGGLARGIAMREELLRTQEWTPSGKVDQLVFDLREDYIRAGRYRDALEALARAQALAPSSGSATAMRAIAVRCWTLTQIGRPDETLMLCRQHGEREDFGPLERWEIEAQRTVALAWMDSLTNARESLAILRRSEPFPFAAHHIRTYMMLAYIEVRAGRADSALAALREADAFGILERQTRQLWALLHARAQRVAGHLERAAEEYRAIVRADASFALAYRELGEVEEQRGRYPEARGAYADCLELWANADPNMLERQELLAQLAHLPAGN